MALNTFTLTPYERRYRQPVLDLLFESARVHTHLDWHEVDQWLDTYDAPMRLYWQDDELMGVIATSPVLSGTCWLRLIAVHDRASGQIILGNLWADLALELHNAEVKTVGVLIINEWLVRYVPGLGFHYDEHVVTLRRTGWNAPQPKASSATIRTALPEDLEAMTAVDNTAFTPLWQLNASELRQAYRISAACSVAVCENEIVGYQLSTVYRNSGHLARLAVSPAVQGQGIGRTLVYDLIQRFWKRHVDTITVNTQSSNRRSQRLYSDYSFRRNGYDLAVWTTHP